MTALAALPQIPWAPRLPVEVAGRVPVEGPEQRQLKLAGQWEEILISDLAHPQSRIPSIIQILSLHHPHLPWSFPTHLNTHFRETPTPVPNPLPLQVQGPPSRESCSPCTQSAVRGSCTLLLRAGEDSADQGRGQQQHFHFHTPIFLRGPPGSSPQPAPLRLRDWALRPWPAQLCFSQLALTYLFFPRFLDYR